MPGFHCTLERNGHGNKQSRCGDKRNLVSKYRRIVYYDLDQEMGLALTRVNFDDW